MGSENHTDDTPRSPDGHQAGVMRIIADFFNPVVQTMADIWRKSFRLFIFLAIPVIFLINATAVHYNLGRFFMDNTDPEYFFLYNGTLIGAGNLSVQYTSNPGTPLMFLIAASTRIVSLFQPGDYFGDVVDDPEKYIHAANFLLVLLISGTLSLGGWYTKKVTGSWLAGLLLQLSLPLSASLMILSGTVKAEAMTILPLLLMSIAVIHYLYRDQDRQRASVKTLVLFGFITGFGMACKLTFIPMILVPLILLRTTPGQKLRLLAYTLVSFAVFAYPVVFNNGDFWGWVGGILSHTGKYGAGSQGFIDLTSVPLNLERLFREEKSFFYVTGFSLVVAIIIFLLSWRYQLPDLTLRLNRAILAVSVAIIATVALVLKHFEVHYFSSFFALKFLLISLLYLMVIRINQFKSSGLIKYGSIVIIFLATALIAIQETAKTRDLNRHYMARKAMQDEKYQKIMSVVEEGSPVILSCRFSGSPFIEFAHYSGFEMSFHLKGSFKPLLKEKFPVSFIYVPWSEEFHYWNDFVDFPYILERANKSFYIFIGEKKAADLPVIEGRIWKVIDKDEVSREVVYQNPATGEQLIRISIL